MATDVTSRRASGSAGASKTPLAIEVRDLKKTFRLPGQKVDSLKERVLHPTIQRDATELKALDGISFDVRQGEFFGIVGRNGSGKSTLLKILAGIYRADGGRVRMAGTLAPFIELGVGFNMELTARENVQLNGVMMGLSRQEAARRLDAVIDFAELHDFVDLKLKNYSSGMLVRLGFSVMIQADTDILLIDEVLAVGDASFQQKCADVFHEVRGSGKTLVLVTHDMGAVDAYCHRAILINDGEIAEEGDPHAVGRHYLRLNYEGTHDAVADLGGHPDEADAAARLVDIWVEDESGERVTTVEAGKDIHLRAVIEARRDIPKPTVAVMLSNADGVQLFGTAAAVLLQGQGTDVDFLRAGQRATLTARFVNQLGNGRYFVDLGINRNHSGVDNVIWVSKATDFLIYGKQPYDGMILLHNEFYVRVEK
jgi:ABC-type polysaccharide/polyol phosphate transport system ATPase subunit